jgi:hypothetical protein
MPDLETRMPELLRDLSTDMPVHERQAAPTLRRARRRRARNASAAVVAVVVLALGSVTVLRELAPAGRHRSAGGGEIVATPSPGFRGIWPETTFEGLRAAQQQVDDGHTPLRTDAAQTAAMLATDLFGWLPDDVGFDRTSVVDEYARVDLTNLRFGDNVPPITVELARLGRPGSRGVWTVVDVTTPLFDGPVVVRREAGRIVLDGRVTEVLDGSSIGFDIRGEDAGAAATAGGAVALGGSSGGAFTASVRLGEANLTSDVLWVFVEDATGKALGATAVRLAPLAETTSIPIAEPTPLPTAVATTRGDIVRAVGAIDFVALRRLMDPNTFSYNFDDGSDPIPAWKQDPSVLDPIIGILALPPAEPKHIEGYGTFYVWPYLVDADFDHLSPDEVDDLHGLGFDDAAIKDMQRFGSYLGPRLSIDQDGLWRNYTTGGD